MVQELIHKVEDKTAIVAVIGLGYVGLPMAMELVRVGFFVYGVDINEERVNRLRKGESYIKDVESIVVKNAVENRFVPKTDFNCIEETDAIILCVPTPLTKAKVPDLSCITDSMDQILPHIKKQTLLVLESTTYPGTTQELMVERIEKEKGWTVGTDFYVCYSPERVDPGNQKYQVANTPKVIGGQTEDCLTVGIQLYQNFIQTLVPVSSLKVAELSKVLENTFRCVNIALMNEMTLLCERLGIDIWETIEAAKTKPFGFQAFYPGPGVGGHCIPLDPVYLSWEAKRHDFYPRFIELAMDVNSNMPYFVVTQITELLAQRHMPIKESKILLLGMAYKKDIDDLRESPSLVVDELLRRAGAKVNYYDPYLPYYHRENEVVYSTKLTQEVIKEQDLVVILTAHSGIDYEWIAKEAACLYDTRNVVPKEQGTKLTVLGDQIIKK